MSWHVDETTLRTYAQGELDQARASSLEAHVLSCASCRLAMTSASDADRLDRIWTHVRDEVDRPSPGVVELFLGRIGMRDHVARLIASTPSLRASWLTALTITLTFAAIASNGRPRSTLAFLIMAPLVPLAGVAVAFGPGVDPTYEVGLAAPMRGTYLVLLRAGTVLVASIVLIGAASFGLPDIGWKSVAWLLPALGISLASIALATWFDPLWATGSVAFAWIAIATISPSFTRGRPTLERIPVFDASGQAACGVLIVVAAAVIFARAYRFDLGRNR